MIVSSLKKIFGISPLGGFVSATLLLIALRIDRYADLGFIAQHAAVMRWVGGVLILCGVGLNGWSFFTLRQRWLESAALHPGSLSLPAPHHVRRPGALSFFPDS